jgi:predicted nucleic acid-binding protein
VDTNVLVYAHDAQADNRHITAKRILAELWDSRDGSLSAQVLQEFYAVATRKLNPAMSRREARGLVAAYGEWCDVATEPQLIVAASRLEESRTLAFRDALVVAAALRAGAGLFLSEDLQDGRQFGPLSVANPFTRASDPNGR